MKTINRKMKGTITAIQRMSIHDGPGIRSTLFLKGCNLHCAWCHNPETWSSSPQIQYISSKCICCGSCIAVCREQALSFGHKVVIDRERCTYCGKCIDACTTNAMMWIGREIDSKEAIDKLLLDRCFYKNSGGGITLSGGEPLLQAEFSREVLLGCMNEGIHTAIETNLTTPWNIIQSLLPLVCLWMCDLKIANSEKHRYWTGIGNKRIIENLKRLATEGSNIIVRTPIIPGVNDTEKDVDALCKIIAELEGNVAYELLSFHALGFEKFENLGMINPMKGKTSLNPEILSHLKQIPNRFGIKQKL